MISIDLAYIYDFRKNLEGIGYINESSFLPEHKNTAINFLHFSKVNVEELVFHSIFKEYLQSCRKPAGLFLQALSSFLEVENFHKEAISTLFWTAEKFEISLKSAFTIFHAYLVTPKGAYDI